MSVSLEQERAAAAWQYSKEGASKEPESYPRLAKSAPAMVMSSGLMQTLAFLREKGSTQHQLLLSHLAAWLSERFDGEATTHPSHAFPAKGRGEYEVLMQALYSANPQQYQRATAEAMAILRWIRQLAATF